MTQKIIICGFPHSGTTILKSIMGHIDEIDEIYEETQKINKETKNRINKISDFYKTPSYPNKKSIF